MGLAGIDLAQVKRSSITALDFQYVVEIMLNERLKLYGDKEPANV